MKRIRFTLVAILLLAIAVAANAEDVAKVEIQDVRADFGEAFARDKYEHTFLIKNVGTADLLIENVKPG